MAFDARAVSGGGIQLFGAKQKHPRLKEYNGEQVLVDATFDENNKTVIVVMTNERTPRLICAMRQQ